MIEGYGQASHRHPVVSSTSHRHLAWDVGRSVAPEIVEALSTSARHCSVDSAVRRAKAGDRYRLKSLHRSSDSISWIDMTTDSKATLQEFLSRESKLRTTCHHLKPCPGVPTNSLNQSLIKGYYPRPRPCWELLPLSPIRIDWGNRQKSNTIRTT